MFKIDKKVKMIKINKMIIDNKLIIKLWNDNKNDQKVFILIIK